MTNDKPMTTDEVKTAQDEVVKYLNQPCCNRCKRGSFEEAYHKLQRAPDRMDYDLIMFEAGKLAAKTQRNFDIKQKIAKAVNEAITKVIKNER